MKFSHQTKRSPLCSSNVFIEGVTEPARLHFSNFMSILKYYYIGQLIKKNICYKRKKKTYIREYKYNKTVVELASSTGWCSLLHSFDYGFDSILPTENKKRKKKVRAREILYKQYLIRNIY